MEPLLVATDLDGTLLDEHTYSAAAARPALDFLRARGIRLVLASSKTRAEMESLCRELDLDPAPALVIENGGALVVPRDLHPGPIPEAHAEVSGQRLVLGVPHAALAAGLPEIAREAGLAVRGFSTMPVEEIARLTDLPLVAAERASRREYDEPFILTGPAEPSPADERRLAAAALVRGLAISRGGRFLHLTGPNDKGKAMRVLLGVLAAALQPHRTIGLGDAPNDLSLLQAVDEPVLIPRADGTIDEALRSALPNARRAPRPGAAGWNDAVLSILGAPTRAAVAAVGPT